MSLVLRPQKPSALPGGHPLIEMVGDTLTIGRGEENDLTLPDPERELSKRHCVLEQRNGDYIVRDISTNGTFLNYSAERLDEMPTPLSHGDVILVGGFELVVEISSGGAANPSDPARNAAPLPPMATASTPRDNMQGGLSRPNTFSVLDDMADTGADFLDDLLSGAADLKPDTADAGLDGIMGPADPLEPLDPAEPFPRDTARGLSDGSSAPDHSPSAQDHFSAPGPSISAIPENWEDSFLAPKPQSSPAADPEPADDPFGEPTPSPVALRNEPITDAAPHAPDAPPVRDAALRAFLEGAGAGQVNIPAAEVEETMARMGKVMAAVIAGMREILMTRAAIKSEMRMDRTMINAGGNNPLKFSISAEQAIEAMIRPSVRGYLDAEAAIDEALSDVKAHEVATMSGMEAALKDLLARLGPKQLSARIEAGSTLGGLLGNKKARYWEAYEKMYAQIAKETEDDFQSAFGKEFARAYEDQVKKL